MEWRKPADKKFTDLCIYIDENISKLTNPGEYPEIENTVYNYLWLLVKALAIKKCMFQNFQDYDSYAFYAAQRLFFALRKNQLNQGKVVKGKLIRPIKSSLNYTKALLYPMKIEFQRETFREIIDEEFVSKKFDAFSFGEQMKQDVITSQVSTEELHTVLAESFGQMSCILDKVLSKTPFLPTSTEYKYLKISLLLNSINNLKLKKKLDLKPVVVTTWKLPKSMSSYVKVLLSEFYTELKLEIMDCYSSLAMDDETATMVLHYREGQDYDYDDSGH